MDEAVTMLEGEDGHRAIVLFSDGKASGDLHGSVEVLGHAKRLGVAIHAVIEVGEAIEVPPGRDRGPEGESIMTQVRHQLETMLEALRARRPRERAT